MICFRRYLVLHTALLEGQSVDIVAYGCKKPCSYRHYKLVGDPITMVSPNPDANIIMLWAVTSNTNTEMEQYDYPWGSMVAELGGTLGLFIGFSFMMIWDGCQEIGRHIKHIFFVRTST